ncbi:hypothetical protein [Runella zeae]|uniref:hypothetical protein n=1 Tax=Runella zeae TaxID=94255 RepID=UPI002357CCFD|nr:hypothetical protein [Runella zeae]
MKILRFLVGVKFPKWLLPTFTYLLTLATGVWLGMVIHSRQLNRVQQLAADAALQEQRLRDSLNVATQLAQNANTIALKDETILGLQQRIRSDSIAHLSELQAIRAINAHLRKK